MTQYPNATKIATERQNQLKEDLKDLIRANGKRQTIIKLLKIYANSMRANTQQTLINDKAYKMHEIQFLFALSGNQYTD